MTMRLAVLLSIGALGCLHPTVARAQTPTQYSEEQQIAITRAIYEDAKRVCMPEFQALVAERMKQYLNDSRYLEHVIDYGNEFLVPSRPYWRANVRSEPERQVIQQFLNSWQANSREDRFSKCLLNARLRSIQAGTGTPESGVIASARPSQPAITPPPGPPANTGSLVKPIPVTPGTNTLKPIDPGPPREPTRPEPAKPEPAKKKVHKPGASAMHCVKLIDEGAASNAGGAFNRWRLANNCTVPVEMFWCTDDECDQDKGNTWTIFPRNTWPVSSRRYIRYGACLGENSGGFQTLSNGKRIVCTDVP